VTEHRPKFRPAVTEGGLMPNTAVDLEPDPLLGEQILDNAPWASLTGPHRRFSERAGQAARYLPDIAPFVALADPSDQAAWRDAAMLVGPGETFAISGSGVAPPAGWTSTQIGMGVQMVDVSLAKAPDPEAIRLGPADVPEILDLVARTQPGPFRPRTIELGTYLGIRHRDALVALAGERLHPQGWTEISAVCTDPAYRGKGLATRLVSAVGAVIADRGDRVLLHALSTNLTAIGLYLTLGFRLRRFTEFHNVTAPVT
jgi:ribosomal protein S18 acetylase RimI-like enzyme